MQCTQMEKWGGIPRIGQLIARCVSEEEGLSTIERSLDLYRLHGTPKERFGDTIQRIGFDVYFRRYWDLNSDFLKICDKKTPFTLQINPRARYLG